MAKKRFHVKLVFEVEECLDDGGHKDFYKNVSDWHDVPHEGVLFMEDLLAGVSDKLLEVGHAGASGLDAAKKAVTKVTKK